MRSAVVFPDPEGRRGRRTPRSRCAGRGRPRPAHPCRDRSSWRGRSGRQPTDTLSAPPAAAGLLTRARLRLRRGAERIEREQHRADDRRGRTVDGDRGADLAHLLLDALEQAAVACRRSPRAEEELRRLVQLGIEPFQRHAESATTSEARRSTISAATASSTCCREHDQGAAPRAGPSGSFLGESPRRACAGCPRRNRPERPARGRARPAAVPSFSRRRTSRPGPRRSRRPSHRL